MVVLIRIYCEIFSGRTISYEPLEFFWGDVRLLPENWFLQIKIDLDEILGSAKTKNVYFGLGKLPASEFFEFSSMTNFLSSKNLNFTTKKAFIGAKLFPGKSSCGLWGVPPLFRRFFGDYGGSSRIWRRLWGVVSRPKGDYGGGS
jgi:hypothetical protein